MILLAFLLGLAHALVAVVLVYRQGLRQGALDAQRTIYPDKERQLTHLREIIAIQRGWLDARPAPPPKATPDPPEDDLRRWLTDRAAFWRRVAEGRRP